MRNTGKVKFFNQEKGFGFIVPDNSQADVFVHISGLNPGVQIKENDRVEFELKDGKRGLNAVDVEVID